MWSASSAGSPPDRTRRAIRGRSGSAADLSGRVTDAPEGSKGSEGAAGSAPQPPAGTPYLPRPVRRPPRPRPNAQAATLWLIFGSFCAIVVIGVAIKANVDRAMQPIE